MRSKFRAQPINQENALVNESLHQQPDRESARSWCVGNFEGNQCKRFPVEVAANVFIGSIGSQSDVLQLSRRIGSQKPIFLELFRHKVNNRTTFGFELKFAFSLVLRLIITADDCATAVRYPLLPTYPLGSTLCRYRRLIEC